MSESLGRQILSLVGGSGNVDSVAHCATRLRMSVKNEGSVQRKKLEDLPGVLGVAEGGGQLQVIVGPSVPTVYEDFVKGSPLEHGAGGGLPANGKKQSLVTRFFDTVAAIFTPLLPLLAGSGVLRGIVLLCNQLGWLKDTSATSIILTAASTAVFYFLPVLLAFTAAERFHANKFVAVAIMGALITPSILDLMGDKGNGVVVHFMGLPIVLMTYTSTVIPALLSVWVLSKLEILLKKIIPENLQLLFVSLLSLLIMVPLTAGIFGPFGVYLGEGLSNVINWLMQSASWMGGLVVGGIWNVFVIFGLQWAVNPVMIQNISAHGFDFIVPLTAAANFGMAGAAFGFFVRCRSKKMKTYSLSALISIFFAGITEPAIYGIAVKYKKPLISAMIGGAAGGAFMGLMHVKAFAFVFGGLTTIPAFVGSTLPAYLIGLAICFFVAFAATFVVGTGETAADVAADEQAIATDAIAQPIHAETLESPAEGVVKDLAEAADPAFAAGTMGSGFIVEPKEGTVTAPVSGAVTMVFKTGHAIGFRSDYGTEVLVHIGFDTVKLGGKYFESLVSVGDRVRQGQPCIKFDLDAVKAAGYDPTIAVVVTNRGTGAVTALRKAGDAALGETVFDISPA